MKGKNMADKRSKDKEMRQRRKELAALDGENNILLDQMIEQGRGHEKPSDYLRKNDALSLALQANYDRRANLMERIRSETGPGIQRRFNPGRKRSKAGSQNMRVGKVFQKKIYGVPAKVRVTKITWNLGKSKLPVLVEVEDVKTRRLYRYWSYAKSLVSRNPRGKRKTRRRALNKLGIRRGWSLRLRYPMRSKRKSLNSRSRKRKRGKNVGRRFVYPVEGPQLFRLSSSRRR